jgi:hypothetical protein
MNRIRIAAFTLGLAATAVLTVAVEAPAITSSTSEASCDSRTATCVLTGTVFHLGLPTPAIYPSIPATTVTAAVPATSWASTSFTPSSGTCSWVPGRKVGRTYKAGYYQCTVPGVTVQFPKLPHVIGTYNAGTVTFINEGAADANVAELWVYGLNASIVSDPNCSISEGVSTDTGPDKQLLSCMIVLAPNASSSVSLS